MNANLIARRYTGAWPSRFLFITVFLMLGLAWPGDVWALEEVYAHDPDLGSPGATSDTTSGMDGWRSYDDFVLPVGYPITEVHWAGVYWDSENPGGNPAPPDSTTWTVAFYADDNGQPGSEIYAETRAVEDVVVHDFGVFVYNGDLVHIYEMRFQLSAPFPAAADTRYWISPLSTSPTVNPFFDWFAAIGGDEMFVQEDLATGISMVLPGDKLFSLYSPRALTDGTELVQPPAVPGEWHLSDTTTGLDGRRVFDDFAFAIDVEISEISWHSGNAGPPGDNPLYPDAYEWEIGIWSDSGGEPGVPLYVERFDAAHAPRMLWNVVTDPNYGALPGFEFRVSLNEAFVALAGQRYWLTALAYSADLNHEMLWIYGTGGDGSSVSEYLGTGQKLTYAGDRAMTLRAASGSDSLYMPFALNPVIGIESPYAFDGTSAVRPVVLHDQNGWWMFYAGYNDGSWADSLPAIGVATSEDGINWSRAPCAPTLAPEGGGPDAGGLDSPVVSFDGSEWTLYYAGWPGPDYLVDAVILRATASDICGPWVRDETPLLAGGSAGAWDDGGVRPDSLLRTAEGWRMYYTGFRRDGDRDYQIGVAFSKDGDTWTKYDDPATAVPAYLESDPVFAPANPPTFDDRQVGSADVLVMPSGYEMYYSGSDGTNVGIGHATSADGIHWTRNPVNPVLRHEDDPAAIWNHTAGPAVVDVGTERWLYYDFLIGGTGLARTPLDSDADGLPNVADNCTLAANLDQRDTDDDGIGNVCDADFDGDCVVNFADLAEMKRHFGSDSNADTDMDGDGVTSFTDLGLFKGLIFAPPGPSGQSNDCEASR